MNKIPLKLAVASKDGISINEHFGHAKQFHIFNVSSETCIWQETREVAYYCLGQHADQSAMNGILEAIKDCYAVFIAKIGDGPTDKVHAIGVIAISEYAYAAIEESLLDYAKKVIIGEDSE